jgi:biopolymer transport protein ExbB
VNTFYTVMGFFIKGGIFMVPILIVGAVALAIAVERYVTLTRLVMGNRRAWNEIEPTLSNADFDGAREKTSKSDTAIGRLLGVGLARLGAVRRLDDIEKALRANLMEIIPHLEKRTHYLATFANLATLLGLLGTVSGLIHAFTAVATANPAEKANLLAGSISEAMNCTAFGLMVAVPLLFIHSFLQTKTSELISSLETGAVKFLTLVADRQSAKAQTRLELAQGAAHGAPATAAQLAEVSEPLPHPAQA